jgi:hypothetical protein
VGVRAVCECVCAYVCVCACVCVCAGIGVCVCMGVYHRDKGVLGLRVRAQHSPVVVPVYATSKSGGPLVFALFDLWALVHPDFVAQVSVAKVIYVTVHVCVYNSRD